MAEKLTCQRVISLMVFLSFILHSFVRYNISIAILEMVAPNNSNHINENNSPHYNWNEEEKNNILGIFFLGYLIAQGPGGRFSEKFGTKMVLGLGFLAANILTLLTPVAARYGYFWISSVRFLLGVSTGVHWPSVPPLCAKWISPGSSSKFMSHMAANSLGVFLAFITCGYLSSYFGWSSAFYVPGAVGMLWTVIWFYAIYDTPQEHPRISDNEREKLHQKIQVVDVETKSSLPWKKMMTSAPVWAVIIANTCSCFVKFFITNQLPTYMGQILHFNIKQNGWISGFPYCVRYFTSILVCALADKLIKTGTYSRTTVRKSCTVICFLGIACCFILQAFFGYNRIVSIAIFTISVLLTSLVFAGVLPNTVDIAPAYSGTLLGIGQIPGSLLGYLSSKFVGLLTKKNQTFEQWSYIFWTAAGINVFTVVFALIFMSGEQQSWSKRSEDREMEQMEICT